MLRSARAAQKPSKSSGKMKSNTSTPTDTDTTGSIGIKPHPTAFHFCLLPRCQPQYRHASACVRLWACAHGQPLRPNSQRSFGSYPSIQPGRGCGFGVPESMSPCWRPETVPDSKGRRNLRHRISKFRNRTSSAFTRQPGSRKPRPKPQRPPAHATKYPNRCA